MNQVIFMPDPTSYRPTEEEKEMLDAIVAHLSKVIKGKVSRNRAIGYAIKDTYERLQQTTSSTSTPPTPRRKRGG